jgi:hypothetical protein
MRAVLGCLYLYLGSANEESNNLPLLSSMIQLYIFRGLGDLLGAIYAVIYLPFFF